MLLITKHCRTDDCPKHCEAIVAKFTRSLLLCVLSLLAGYSEPFVVSPYGVGSLPGAHFSFLQAKNLSKKKGGGKKRASGATRGGGGFGAKVATKKDDMFSKVIAAKVSDLKSSPTNAQTWLELGSILIKRGDYAEAEEVFRIGNECSPGVEMLNGAYVALAGHSAQYFGGERTQKIDDAATSAAFETYDVNQPAEDFRTVTWTARGDKPRVQVSTGPLIPKEECAKAIEIAEIHAANTPGGWTSSRHTQAATTDLPVKDVPELLEWFNSKLETSLFPMLASRYPDKIKSASDIRAHDAFIVKYDSERQNSLVKHVDESAFSFTIALNDRDEYEGGGTEFEAIRLEGGNLKEYEPLVLNADAGGVVAFPGTIRHGGNRVTKGIRYIIPLFCYLHENKSGEPKGYVTKGLSGLVKDAQKTRSQQRLLRT